MIGTALPSSFSCISSLHVSPNFCYFFYCSTLFFFDPLALYSFPCPCSLQSYCHLVSIKFPCSRSTIIIFIQCQVLARFFPLCLQNKEINPSYGTFHRGSRPQQYFGRGPLKLFTLNRNELGAIVLSMQAKSTMSWLLSILLPCRIPYEFVTDIERGTFFFDFSNGFCSLSLVIIDCYLRLSCMKADFYLGLPLMSFSGYSVHSEQFRGGSWWDSSDYKSCVWLTLVL